MVKGNQPSLQKAVFDAIQKDGPRDPDHTELDYGHGRIIRRSIWVTSAEGIGFPHVTRIARVRRDPRRTARTSRPIYPESTSKAVLGAPTAPTGSASWQIPSDRYLIRR